MRLIDADKLQDDGVNYSYDKSENFGVISTEYRFINRVQIDNAPTVEAIPVEWIEKWGWENGMSESMSLRVMIDDWEKENETDRQGQAESAGI